MVILLGACYSLVNTLGINLLGEIKALGKCWGSKGSEHFSCGMMNKEATAHTSREGLTSIRVPASSPTWATRPGPLLQGRELIGARFKLNLGTEVHIVCSLEAKRFSDFILYLPAMTTLFYIWVTDSVNPS